MKAEDFAAVKQNCRESEGLRLKLYQDTVGVWTIGYGRNIQDRGISLEIAEQWLQEDVDEAYADLMGFGWFGGLSPIRQRALVELRFQLGYRRFRGFVKMLSAIERREFETAARELRASVWWDQVGPARRERLFAMLRDGVER